MSWQLRYEHITGLSWEMKLYIFLISNFITKEVGSTEKNPQKTNTEKLMVI